MHCKRSHDKPVLYNQLERSYNVGNKFIGTCKKKKNTIIISVKLKLLYYCV